MQVKLAAVSSIKPYDQNPRKNGDAVAAVAASIQEFGFQQPIVVDSEMVIIVGHTRWAAARDLGLKKVPVTIAKNLTPEQVRAYRIADNKTNEKAEWDADLLALELGDLRDTNFDLGLLGFDPGELERALAGEGDQKFSPNLAPEAADDFVDENQVRRAGDKLRDQFAHGAADKLVTVCCPHCAQEFALDRDAL
jgi:ParB-like chromosome segregation protein Spo0J